MLVNTVFFKASWRDQFPKHLTADRAFTKLDGAQVMVPTMNHPQLGLRQGRVDGVDIIELPYKGDEVSMLLLVPPAGALPAFEASLTGAKLSTLTKTLARTEVSLSLPRFKARNATNMKDVLMSLGLTSAFSSSADFSGIDGTRSLSISEVVHEAVVTTDETGSEAAAATAVVVTRDAASPTPLTVDRPFMYLLRHTATGVPLFVGRIGNPSL